MDAQVISRHGDVRMRSRRAHKLIFVAVAAAVGVAGAMALRATPTVPPVEPAATVALQAPAQPERKAKATKTRPKNQARPDRPSTDFKPEGKADLLLDVDVTEAKSAKALSLDALPVDVFTDGVPISKKDDAGTSRFAVKPKKSGGEVQVTVEFGGSD